MNKTRQVSEDNISRIAVTTPTLAKMLDCGEGLAKTIGLNAEACIDTYTLGVRRTLWNVQKIQEYLDLMCA